MASFVLIHGGMHRARHWDLLRPLLEERGHRTFAPEVAMDDVDAGVIDWSRSIATQMGAEGVGDDAIAVGHSLAGLALPVLASLVPMRRMVFLGALVPVPGVAFFDYASLQGDCITTPMECLEEDDVGRLFAPWRAAREYFYPDVDPDLARQAHSWCVPVAATAFTESCPVKEWPDVPGSFVIGVDDKATGLDWARRTSLQRLGEPVIEIAGGHSPFLARPALLAEVLDRVASL